MSILNNPSMQRFLVLGLAKSGTVAATYLLKHSYAVRVSDLTAKESDGHVKKLQKLGAELVLGSHPMSILENIDCIVKNPGIPFDIDLLQEAERRNIQIITEIELSREIMEGRMIGVTGSNGKTTTTTLITKMLEKNGTKVKAAGNIGTVSLEAAEQSEEDETMVIELSSFQLLHTKYFRPEIAVILNVFPAHLDYHQTMDHYVNAKLNIFKHQQKNDLVIYNYDDPLLREKVENAPSKRVPFSAQGLIRTGAWADETYLYYRDEKIISKDAIVLVGEHNIENILAAIAVVKNEGCSNEAIVHVLEEFGGVEHRLQFVRRLNDRLFYNDSKATNLLATEKALSAFQRPTILLCGGLDRGDDLDLLIPLLSHVKGMVTFGETSKLFQETAKKAGVPFIKGVTNIKEAVEIGYQHSEQGDVILLSPACASWDQYKTFEQRGNIFIEAVHTLV